MAEGESAQLKETTYNIKFEIREYVAGPPQIQ